MEIYWMESVKEMLSAHNHLLMIPYPVARTIGKSILRKNQPISVLLV
jgi:hypothetical protein